MAKKIVPPEETAAAELDVLNPDRTINIAGEKLTVREYNLVDSLEMHEPIAALTQELATVMRDGPLFYEDVEAILARHVAIVPLLAARAVDKPADWAEKLSATDGATLLDWWWVVNRHFFMTAAVRRITVQAVREKQSDSPLSSPPSSAPDTMPSDSATTPGAS